MASGRARDELAMFDPDVVHVGPGKLVVGAISAAASDSV
jgi:hypothetical protein